MPAPCSLLLEVYTPISIYDDTFPTIDWAVSSDPDHSAPYLLAPRNYAEQEIDPISCTATIGTVEVGVIDAPIELGDQTTGFMTEKVFDLLGRRCRLRRWIDDTSGWATIADGVAGPPKMDPSYSAYRWNIRDTRETERKLSAFDVGGVSGVMPRGPLYGFGRFTIDSALDSSTEDDFELMMGRVLDVAVTGVFNLSSLGPYQLGLVNLFEHFSGGGVDDARMVMDQDAIDAVQISEIATNTWGCRNADVIWRKEGDLIWNVSRPTSPISLPQPFVGLTDAPLLIDGDGTIFQCADYVTLFVAHTIPDGNMRDLVEGDRVQVIVRYRGPANEKFPYYVEGDLGEVLKNLYDGVYSMAPTDEIEGDIYDPAGMDTVETPFASRMQYDANAFDQMTDHVMLRQTEIVDDVRSWAETALYAPSGWIPALDSDMFISPVSRTPPESVSDALSLDDEFVSPAPDWTNGERTVSEIIYNYKRYFIPADDDEVTQREPDGVAIRPVTIGFDDAESALRYGPQVSEYDASAFSAVGTEDGVSRTGQIETASLLCQTAKFDVLDRFRAGVQSIGVTVRRELIPAVRVGDWVPASLMYLPDRTTGLRGSDIELAQVVSLRDDDCTWRTLLVEESRLSDGPPGLVTDLQKTNDEPSAGGITMRVISDVESY